VNAKHPQSRFNCHNFTLDTAQPQRQFHAASIAPATQPPQGFFYLKSTNHRRQILKNIYFTPQKSDRLVTEKGQKTDRKNPGAESPQSLEKWGFFACFSFTFPISNDIISVICDTKHYMHMMCKKGATMTEKAKEARRAYKRAWQRNNPDKVRAQQERYWNKKAAEGETGKHPEAATV
jgi:hypothetical protein